MLDRLSEDGGHSDLGGGGGVRSCGLAWRREHPPLPGPAFLKCNPSKYTLKRKKKEKENKAFFGRKMRSVQQ